MADRTITLARLRTLRNFFGAAGLDNPEVVAALAELIHLRSSRVRTLDGEGVSTGGDVRLTPEMFAAGSSEELRAHVNACPLGWHNARVLMHRATTDEDVIKWLQRLQALVAAAPSSVPGDGIAGWRDALYEVLHELDPKVTTRGIAGEMKRFAVDEIKALRRRVEVAEAGTAKAVEQQMGVRQALEKIAASAHRNTRGMTAHEIADMLIGALNPWDAVKGTRSSVRCTDRTCGWEGHLEDAAGTESTPCCPSCGLALPPRGRLVSLDPGHVP